MKNILTLLLFLPLYTQAQNKDERAITQMLSAQVEAWNKGSIEGFMKGYWDNDSLLFIGSKGPRYGYKAAMNRYKEAYPDTAQMGRLISTVTRMQKLSREYYFVVGKWELKRSVGDIGGSYTLLLRKIDGEWVIVCDHSS
jgi:ketosteroid isomerase-like protein